MSESIVGHVHYDDWLTMISVIIPAHNEETVIARGLRAIVTGAEPGELEVIVVCNGCSDRTAEIAMAFGTPVRVLNVSVASKIAALNAGDAAATGTPRFYVDADVVIDLASIRKIAALLEGGGALAAWPQLDMNLAQTSWPVRAFYRAWTSLPYNREHGAVGTGVYALSRVGRSRFGAFPDVIADDGFVRFLFEPSERATVPGAISRVEPPRSLAGLIRIKTRSRLGQFQLRALGLTRATTDAHSSMRFAIAIASRPCLWLDAIVYAVVNLITRIRAQSQLRRAQLKWERDDSREPPACPSSRLPR